MTKSEFKLRLNSYRDISNLCKEVFARSNPDEKFFTFHIKNGRVKVSTEYGMNFDITKEVLEELMPDDFVF